MRWVRILIALIVRTSGVDLFFQLLASLLEALEALLTNTSLELRMLMACQLLIV
jgi:hypothetical protein